MSQTPQPPQKIIILKQFEEFQHDIFQPHLEIVFTEKGGFFYPKSIASLHRHMKRYYKISNS